MFENSKKILASANIPVIIAKAEGEIRVRKFKCKDTGTTLVANYMAQPLSPITGGKMIPANNKVLTLSAKDVANFTKLGTCPHCKAELASVNNVAKSLAGEKIHCIVCGEELQVEEATSPQEYIDMIEKNVQDAKSRKEVKAEAEEIDEGMNSAVENEAEDYVDGLEEVEAEADEEMKEMEPEADEADEEMEQEEVVEEAEADEEEAPEAEGDEQADEASNEEEIRVDMLSRVQAGINSKKMELVASRNQEMKFLMVANKPVATLHKSRANQEVKEIFSNTYLLESSLIEAVEKEGMSKPVISAFGIVPLVLKVKANDVIAKACDDRMAKLQSDFDKKEEEMEEAYEQSLGIASVGINRGTFADCKNVLAEDIIENLEDAGVEDAREIVESSFNARGEDYLRTIVAKAQEFKNKSAEVRNEIANTVLASNFNGGLNLKHKAVASYKSEANAQINDEDVSRYKKLLEKY